MRRIALALAVAAVVTGCTTVGPDYRRPEVSLPASFPGADTASAAQAVAPEWWKLFGDPVLDRLVDSALKKNTDIRLAVARIEEAEAFMREVGANFYPVVQGNAAASRSRVSNAGSIPVPPGSQTRTDYQLTAGTSFEIDFWGRLRRTSEAARAQFAATSYGRDVVVMTLAAAVAQTYFSVRSLEAQAAVAQGTFQSNNEAASIIRKRAEAGLVSDLDVNQAETAASQSATQVKELERLRAASLHQLGALVGELDLALATADVREIAAPPLPPPGLPSELLERRPDVRQAEAQLAAANAQIGVARAAQLPTLSLTASLGTQSRALGDLLSSGAGIWSVGLGLVGPIFDAGRYAARTEQAEARQRQAAAQYQRAAETAFREVADSLTNTAYVRDVDAQLQQTVERARSTLRLAQIRYESGYSAFLTVLDAQRTLNEAELALVRNRQAYLSYSVDLMKSLGGGWAGRAEASARR